MPYVLAAGYCVPQFNLAHLFNFHFFFFFFFSSLTQWLERKMKRNVAGFFILH